MEEVTVFFLRRESASVRGVLIVYRLPVPSSVPLSQHGCDRFVDDLAVLQRSLGDAAQRQE